MLERLVLGTWALADDNWPNQERRASIQTIHAALATGIRRFDTAQRYGNGRAEQLLGQQLRRFRFTIQRSQLSIATKLTIPADLERTRQIVETSLRRLQVDYLDTLYVHWPSSRRPTEPLLERLVILQQEGLIRSLGLSNFPPALLEKLAASFPIATVQFPLSLLWPNALQTLIPFCQQHNIVSEVYGALSSGLLSGNYRGPEDFATEDWRRSYFYFDSQYKNTFLALLDHLSKRSKVLKTSIAALAYAWLFRQPIEHLLLGCRSRAQLEESLLLLNTLPQIDDWAIEEALAETLSRQAAQLSDNPFFHRW